MHVERVYKVKEGRPNVVDLIKGDRIQLIINTPHGAEPWFDEKAIRRAAVTHACPDHDHAVGGARRRRRHRRPAARRSQRARLADAARATSGRALRPETVNHRGHEGTDAAARKAKLIDRCRAPPPQVPEWASLRGDVMCVMVRHARGC